jgi:hypothetical protein
MWEVLGLNPNPEKSSPDLGSLLSPEFTDHNSMATFHMLSNTLFTKHLITLSLFKATLNK